MRATLGARRNAPSQLSRSLREQCLARDPQFTRLACLELSLLRPQKINRATS